MVNTNTEFTPNDLSDTLNMLEASMRPFLLDQKISEVEIGRFEEEHARNIKIGAIPAVRCILVDNTVGSEPVIGDLVEAIASRVLDYATRNGYTVGELTESEFNELPHFAGLTYQASSLPLSGVLLPGVALWRPKDFQTAPFRQWIPSG